MLYWLAQAAKQARETAERKQVHVAAEADKDQSSVYRFEQGEAWPRDTDLMVTAYAQDLDIDVIDLWEAALKMWRESGEKATVAELAGRREVRSRSRVESELDEGLEREAARADGRGTAGGRTGRAPRRTARAH